MTSSNFPKRLNGPTTTRLKTMTKIIFLDIDGTLLSFRTHHVPASTIETVRRARQQGVKVWIATGRPLPFVSKLDGLEYDGIMCVNGAQCQILVSTEGGGSRWEVIHSQPVPKEDVERMIAEQHRTGTAVVYAGNEQAILTAPKGVPSFVDEIFTMLAIKVPPYVQPEEALGFTVMQVIAFYPEAEQKHILSDILKGCDDTRWHPVFADCIAKGTNKASGIDHVIRHYGFALSETMAFGDGGNDIEMLRHAGVGVAMGNASDEVKAAADIVTDSVDDDGVAKVLRRIVLI